METNESKELFLYIDQIIKATQNGTIEWARANPTTFIWTVSQQKGARVIIQRVERASRTPDEAGRLVVKKSTTYVLHATDETGVVKLNVNGEEDAEANNKLEELFNVLTKNISRKGLDFLKSLIPS